MSLRGILWKKSNDDSDKKSNAKPTEGQKESCKWCGKETRNEEVFCSKCGRKLRGADNDRDVLKCPKCGS
ncbi:MAG: zinc-ribbon domain-containing protein, partial [Candidatus Aenigmarchaeota archaeon]|nr:zinc-ribbon domain-containing protein [Candidatus Aenigmarchaeota archaeon]